MIYLYGNEECSNCKKKEQEFKEAGVEFIKRDASRMKTPEDEIDLEALVIGSMQNLSLPIIVDTNRKD